LAGSSSLGRDDQTESSRTSEPFAAGSTHPREPIPEPSDAELERAIVEAVMRGLDGVAKTLAAALDERRRRRIPDNVVDLRARKEPLG
jgi:hypothetical protein